MILKDLWIVAGIHRFVHRMVRVKLELSAPNITHVFSQPACNTKVQKIVNLFGKPSSRATTRGPVCAPEYKTMAITAKVDVHFKAI